MLELSLNNCSNNFYLLSSGYKPDRPKTMKHEILLMETHFYKIFSCKEAEKWDWNLYTPAGIDGSKFYTYLFMAEVFLKEGWVEGI